MQLMSPTALMQALRKELCWLLWSVHRMAHLPPLALQTTHKAHMPFIPAHTQIQVIALTYI